jgi:hypothetical protein
MIPVQRQPEPASFVKKVKTPGDRFLGVHPHPASWKGREYWQKIINELWDAYSGVCAYACHWIPPDTGGSTVEHFIPKSVNPGLAYRWDNYRLVCSRLNGRKSDFQDVLDLFTLQDGWFHLGFPSLIVVPNPALPDADKTRVRATIARLKLNDDPTCLKARQVWLREYCQGTFPFSHLQKKAPFIARELARQDLVNTIAAMLVPPRTSR